MFTRVLSPSELIKPLFFYPSSTRIRTAKSTFPHVRLRFAGQVAPYHQMRRPFSATLKPQGHQKKMNIGISVFMGGLFLFSTVTLYVTTSMIFKDSTLSVFSSKEGWQWADECVQAHVELLWIAHIKSHRERPNVKEGPITRHGTYSEQLFGQKHRAFDDTLVSLKAFKLILEGTRHAYLTFTTDQPENAKLSPESFTFLHHQGHRLLKSKWGGLSPKQMAQAMETAIILSHLGKNENAHLTPSVATHTQKDYPSFARLPSAAQELLVKTINLMDNGQIMHLEGGPAMLSPIKKSNLASKDPHALGFALFIYKCNVAGALGHLQDQSCLAYTQNTHHAIQAMQDAIEILTHHGHDEWDVYHAYLNKRAEWLALDYTQDGERMLTRASAMMHLFTQEEGKVVKDAFNQLPPHTRTLIIKELDIKPQPLQEEAIPPSIYMCDILMNLSKHPSLGTTKEERLSQAITIGLPFIAHMLAEYRTLCKGQRRPRLLDFKDAAEYAALAPSMMNPSKWSFNAQGRAELLLHNK